MNFLAGLDVNFCFLCICVQISVWDSLTWWWRSDEVGAIRKRKKPMSTRAMLKPRPKE